MIRLFSITSFTILFFCFSSAQAKWADVSGAAIKKDISNIEVVIKKDGSHEEIVEERFEILKESARGLAAHYTLVYNADSEKIEIINAKTIYLGQEYIIDKKFIEDKPLASAPAGFDQMNQVLLAYPKAEVGAKIYIKYKKTTNKAALKDHYSDFMVFGFHEWLTNANLKIQSELPLYLQVNDPDKNLKIKTDRLEGFSNLEISLDKEIFRENINEPENAITNYKSLTWISVSNFNKWEDLSRAFAIQNFNKIYNQELPGDFLEIKTKAAKENNEIDQINMVTSALNDKIQYMMDNRTIEGRLMPRDLSQISKSQLGDCKDLSAATLAILTKMGYEAQFAIVLRGEGKYLPELLPTIGSFNHVIVKVTGKNGQIYWIDPTNIQSMANGLFPDVAGKPTLILDSKNPAYEKIPGIRPEHANVIHKREFEIGNENKVTEKGNITLENEEAYPLIGAMLITSADNLKDMILAQISGTILDATNNPEVTMPDLHSRIVKDIFIEYSYKQNNKMFKTNLGRGIKLNYNKLGMDNFVHVNNDIVSDVYIGSPNTFIRQTIIRNVDIKTPEVLNSNIRTKWLDISRNLTFKDNNLVIDDIIVIKKEVITNDELKTLDFMNLKHNLENNFKDVSLIFN